MSVGTRTKTHNPYSKQTTQRLLLGLLCFRKSTVSTYQPPTAGWYRRNSIKCHKQASRIHDSGKHLFTCLGLSGYFWYSSIRLAVTVSKLQTSKKTFPNAHIVLPWAADLARERDWAFINHRAACIKPDFCRKESMGCTCIIAGKPGNMHVTSSIEYIALEGSSPLNPS